MKTAQLFNNNLNLTIYPRASYAQNYCFDFLQVQKLATKQKTGAYARP